MHPYPDDSRRSAASIAFLPSRILEPLHRFLQVEAASGVVLLTATALALLCANSPWSTVYESVWHLPVRIGIGGRNWETSLHFLVNDCLMTVFFLVVGLEIRRELHDGTLANARQAVVPVVVALGGIVVPALIYLAFVGDDTLRRGWAVPTATDIAFAVGVLMVLGKRVSAPVRTLLLALAVIDDVAAILVIAFFYSSGLDVSGLLIAGCGIAGVLAFQRLGIRKALAYLLPGTLVWAGLLRAGMHPTLAGVILGLLTPAAVPWSPKRLLESAVAHLQELRARLERDGSRLYAHEVAAPVKRLQETQGELLPPVERVQLLLHPWVAFGIMPLFAFANAGVRLDGLALAATPSTVLTLAVVVALVFGKPLGIVSFTWFATRSGLASLPAGLNWRGVWLVGCLGGIGFTMSLFIAQLAFSDASLLASAKFAVLLASVVAGVGGLLLGRYVLFRSIDRTAS